MRDRAVNPILILAAGVSLLGTLACSTAASDDAGDPAALSESSSSTERNGPVATPSSGASTLVPSQNGGGPAAASAATASNPAATMSGAHSAPTATQDSDVSSVPNVNQPPVSTNPQASSQSTSSSPSSTEQGAGGAAATAGVQPSVGGAPESNTGGAADDEGDTASAERDAGAEANSAGSGSGPDVIPMPAVASTIFIAGDSTVSTYTDTASTTDQAGWGQMLHEHFTELVTIENRAIGGRTARRFIDEGYLAEIDAELSAGDTLLVQFGTNDGNRTAMYELDGEQIPYYLEPGTDFKTYLGQYIDVAAAHDATLVLVTPPPRNSAYCTGGNGTGGHAEAMRELAAERSVALSDLNQRSVEYLKAICPAPTPEDFFLSRADGTVDGTHFQENGARILAGFVVEGLIEAAVPVVGALK